MKIYYWLILVIRNSSLPLLIIKLNMTNEKQIVNIHVPMECKTYSTIWYNVVYLKIKHVCFND